MFKARLNRARIRCRLVSAMILVKLRHERTRERSRASSSFCSSLS